MNKKAEIHWTEKASRGNHWMTKLHPVMITSKWLLDGGYALVAYDYSFVIAKLVRDFMPLRYVPVGVLIKIFLEVFEKLRESDPEWFDHYHKKYGDFEKIEILKTLVSEPSDFLGDGDVEQI